MTAKTKKPHNEDVMFAEIAANATRFSAFLFGGRGARHRKEATTFEEAVRGAKALEAEHPEAAPRRALVYAITPKNDTIAIDETIARLAGFPEDAIALLIS